MANRDPKTGRFIKQAPPQAPVLFEDADDEATSKAALVVVLALIFFAVVVWNVL